MSSFTDELLASIISRTNGMLVGFSSSAVFNVSAASQGLPVVPATGSVFSVSAASQGLPVVPATGSTFTVSAASEGLPVNTERYSNRMISLASVTIAQSTAGFFHAVTVAAPSLPTTTFYDSASGASGPIIITMSNALPGSYLINQSLINGLTVDVLPGVTPQLLINKR